MDDKQRAALVEQTAKALYLKDPCFVCDAITDDGDEINRRSVPWEELPPGSRKAKCNEVGKIMDLIDIDRIQQEAYAKGQRDAYNDAAKDMQEMEREFRDEIREAYREGAINGMEW